MKAVTIFGSPGTGKTYSLIQQIKKLKNSYEFDDILVLSFTRIAAKEIVSRSGGGVRASTIHSLAYNMGEIVKEQVISNKDLREFSEKIGIPMKGMGIDIAESMEIGDEYISIISVAINKLINPIDFYKNNMSCVGNFEEFEYFYNSYNVWKNTYGMIDFNDMIKNAFDYVVEKIDFKVLLIDETQDLTYLQWLFIYKILDTGQIEKIIIVGDPDQSLFLFAGADSQGMIKFIKKYDSDIQELKQSYRVPKIVHSYSKKIIEKVKNRYKKDYFSTKNEGSFEIYASIQHYDFTALDNALMLYRTHSLRQEIEEELIRLNMPYMPLNGKFGLCNNYYGNALRIIAKLESGENISKKEIDMIKKASTKYGKKVLINNFQEFIKDKFNYLAIPGMYMEYYKEVDFSKKPTIKLSTIHGAKGLEAETVVIFNGMTQRVTEEMEKNSDPEIMVWYVAITRSSNKVIWIEGTEEGYQL